MSPNPIFHDYTFGDKARKELDHVGHFVLPKLLTINAQARLTESLARVESLIPGCKKGMNRIDLPRNMIVTLKV